MKFTFPPESTPLEGYTIKRAIHRGGFGEVYYALSDGGKEVALKLIQHNLEVELRGVSQCLNLKHPNLVTIFDIRTDGDGDHWIVMEYVSGKSLAEVLDDRDKPMEATEVQKWLTDIAAGLGFLHDHGIVHRDLKPANVYTEHNSIKLGDVGLAKFISESRRSAQTQSVGTVYYMAPEVAHGRYGREVDIYGLGVMLYEMLTGKVPFDGESTAEILMKHLSEKPDLSPLPKNIRPVLAKALEKDPMRRTPTVQQLVEDFNKALQGIEVAYEIPDTSFVDGANNNNVDVKNKTHGDLSDSRFSNTRGMKKKDWKAARKRWDEERKVTRHERKKDRKATKLERKLAAKQSDKYHDPGVKVRVVERDMHPHRVATRHKGSPVGFWLRVAAVVVILMLLFGPGGSITVLGAAFIVGVYGALGYGLYRLITFVTVSKKRSTTSADSSRSIRHEPKSVPVSFQPRPQISAMRKPGCVREISLQRRLGEMTGSMAFAVLATAIITAGLSMTGALLESPEHIALFGITTLLGAWSVIGTAKLWEGTRVESGTRRLTMMLAGALVGAGAFWLHETLLVSIPFHDLVPPIFNSVGSYQLVDVSAQSTLAGYVLFFAALFGLRGWWRHADSYRKRRFRLLSVALTMLLGYVLTAIWAFPPLWGITWAAAISSVVHLSSVWIPSHERTAMTGGSHHV